MFLFLWLTLGIKLHSFSFAATQLEDSKQNSEEKKSLQEDVSIHKDFTKKFYSLSPPEPYLSIFSGMGTSYATEFRTYSFKNYALDFLKYQDKTIKEEVCTSSALDIYFALAYKHFLFKNLLQFQFGSQQFFDSKGFVISSKEKKNFQTLYIPEMHFVLNFFSIGLGVPIPNNQVDIMVKSKLYNPYFPIFSTSTLLKLYKWPSFLFASFYLHSASSLEDLIYSGSAGVQVDLTYYITLSFSYKGVTKSSEKIRDNSAMFDFHYRILKNLSGSVSFIQSVYSETQNPYNEFSFKMGYRHSFLSPKKFSENNFSSEKLSPDELKKVQEALNSLLKNPSK